MTNNSSLDRNAPENRGLSDWEFKQREFYHRRKAFADQFNGQWFTNLKETFEYIYLKEGLDDTYTFSVSGTKDLERYLYARFGIKPPGEQQ